MRLLHERHYHDGRGPSCAKPAGEPSGDPCDARRAASMPVRDAAACSESDRSRTRRGETMSALPANLAANPVLSRWIKIDPAGTVTVCPGKVEIGQGVST